MTRQSLRANPKILVVKNRQANPARPVSLGANQRRYWWLLILLILAAGLYYSPMFSVKEVQILSGDGLELPLPVKDQLQRLRSQPIFSPAINRLVRSLTSSRSDLVYLNCQRGLPSTLRCQVGLRAAKLIWERNGQRLLVDETGLAYQMSETEAPELIIVEDQSTSPVILPASVASREVISSYRLVRDRLAAQNIRLEKVIVEDALYHFRARVSQPSPTNGPTAPARALEIRLSLNHSLDNQLATLVALLNQKGAAVIDRIDLRVPGYVYYH